MSAAHRYERGFVPAHTQGTKTRKVAPSLGCLWRLCYAFPHSLPLFDTFPPRGRRDLQGLRPTGVLRHIPDGRHANLGSTGLLPRAGPSSAHFSLRKRKLAGPCTSLVPRKRPSHRIAHRPPRVCV